MHGGALPIELQAYVCGLSHRQASIPLCQQKGMIFINKFNLGLLVLPQPRVSRQDH